jgi:cytochrome c nitrite reductase small subunit
MGKPSPAPNSDCDADGLRDSLRLSAVKHCMKLLLNVLIGIFLGASGFTFYSGRAASYLSNEPQVCVNCHVMREHFDGWQKASHHSFATCNDCHMPHDFIGKWMTKASNGYHHSIAFTYWIFRDPIRIKPGNAEILNANCLVCHRNFVGEITAHRVVDDSELYCVRCHEGVGHGPDR